MESVKAKFRFDSRTIFGYGGSQIKLSAVYGKEGENADFATATPSGNFEMHIAEGVPAADFFTSGDEYYITITKAPKK